jgi:hypothetical protein
MLIEDVVHTISILTRCAVYQFTHDPLRPEFKPISNVRILLGYIDRT